ncbi:gas vesicle protein GvpG [Streptantibioticus rubrisoli]|uniref:Gas vesicle protein GvpG n=1 Tax=Streptantibioticus rubrisoli TaxID=1387313 RepID=A0ABT1PFV1_9ACTN|nr:gas vesicle protein GvpG [Streptantibioticus rubrisoli]MCQ4044244.1 gas vesicle protein GvpG [Streptantibioticus rubrisoli]
MGLVTDILTLPAAPVRGIWWVLDKVVRAAEDEYYDPAPVQEALVKLEDARIEGRIDDEEFARREDELMRRLEEIRAYQLRSGGQGGL